MKKKDILQFVIYNKKIRVRTYDNFYYRGKILDLNDEAVTIEDIELGPVVIDLKDLRNVTEWQDEQIFK